MNWGEGGTWYQKNDTQHVDTSGKQNKGKSRSKEEKGRSTPEQQPLT